MTAAAIDARDFRSVNRPMPPRPPAVSLTPERERRRRWAAWFATLPADEQQRVAMHERTAELRGGR